MILAICSTPFQILNLLTMKKHLFQEEKVDLVMLDHASVNYSIHLKLKETGIFNEVFFAETKDFIDKGKSNLTFFRDLTELKHFKNKDLMTNQVPFERYDYDRVIVAFDDPPSHVFWHHIKTRNPKAELYLIEDGTKTYSFFDFNLSRFKSFYLKKMFKLDFYADIKGAYLHRPEYFTQPERNLDLIRIPPLDKESPTVRQVMNDVFNYEEEKGTIDSDTRFIFFDQAFSFESELDEQERLYKLLKTTSSEEEVVVKMHPRNQRHVYTRTMAEEYPFELLEINNKMEEKVLVSPISTGCMSPKLIFNEEPYVIMLYKVFNSPIFHEEQQSTFKLAEKVQASYENKDRFFIPETEEELKDIIAELSLKTSVYSSVQISSPKVRQPFYGMGLDAKFEKEKE